MRGIRSLLNSLALAALVLGLPFNPLGASEPPDYVDFSELDLESLLDQTIVTASKYEQKLSDSPVAATVITREDIAASGARSIPELLRDVPGMDVIHASSSGYDVSARGLNSLAANTLLVLVDGRSVYIDVYALTMWEQLPVSLEDIQAIEVIKGPGSAMHGANAFAGVINIVTIAPGEHPGTSMRTMASSRGEAYGSLRHSDRRGPLAWKLNTTWDRALDWERMDQGDRGEIESENVRWDAHVRHDLGPDSWAGLSGGLVNGNTVILPSDTYLRADGNSGYVRADYQHRGFSAQIFRNRWDLRLTPVSDSISSVIIDALSTVDDVELRQSLTLGSRHHVLLGASYRHKHTEFNTAEADESIWAGFVLEEWRPSESWSVSAGVRFEDHPLQGQTWAPRGGLVFKPAQQHAFRASYSKAHRAPSYLESYWQQEVSSIPGFPLLLRGDLDNSSETIEALEAGYQGLLHPNLLANVAVFHNTMDDLITMRTVGTYPSPPAPFEGIPAEMAFVNANAWTAVGGEFSLESDLKSWLRLSTQYSYVWLEDSDTGGWKSRAPRHHASITARLRPGGGHQIVLVGRHRSRAAWEPSAWLEGDDGKARAFSTMDLTWSLRLDAGGHRAVVGLHNVFDNRYREHPLALEQERRFLASLAMEF